MPQTQITNPRGAYGETPFGESQVVGFVSAETVTTIAKGDIVMIDTATGTGTKVKQLPAGSAGNLLTVGVALAAIAPGAEGQVVVYGPVAQVNMEAGGAAGNFIIATNVAAGRGTGNAAATLGATVGILLSAVAGNVASAFIKQI